MISFTTKIYIKCIEYNTNMYYIYNKIIENKMYSQIKKI